MGSLITFEGGEGSGKGTIAKKLLEYLKGKGKNAILYREPGSAKIAEEIRKIIQKPRKERMNPITELLLFEAARAQFVEEVLYPAVNEHDFVILDRFYDSTTVYQGYARGIDLEIIELLNKMVSAGLVPDITFILDVSPDIGLKRSDKSEFGGRDRIENEGSEFHERIREGYLALAENSDRFMVIDSNKNNSEIVFEQVKEAINPLLS